MPAKRFFFCAVLLLAAALLTGCVSLTNHDDPGLKSDFSAFTQVGCGEDAAACAALPQLAAFGCQQIRPAPDTFGGFQPALSAAICELRPNYENDGIQNMMKEGRYFYINGCMLPGFVRYIIATDGGFRLVSTPDELRAVYGGVDSPEEATAYAAAGGFYPIYTLPKPGPQMKYLVNKLEATHVVQSGGGYQVNLFQNRLCGCGPHPAVEVVFDVAPDGRVSAGDPRQVFKNPEYDQICVD